MKLLKQHRQFNRAVLFTSMFAAMAGCHSEHSTTTTPASETAANSVPPSEGTWSLVWSDEFEGSSLDPEHWNIETGDGSQYGLTGWGNNELEWYDADNLNVSDGMLAITALEQENNGYPYTSGRLHTKNKVDIKYGRIEARIQVPAGQGLWSAFWMLPTDSRYGGWASGGEIDIMEAVNPGSADEDLIHGTVHYGMAWPFNVSAGDHIELSPVEDFHTYAVEWEQDEIRWYIDDLHYATVTSDNWWSYFFAGTEQGYLSAPQAPFDQEFHILLNLAVGGNWPGAPDAQTVFPAQMLVDYVRVYQCDTNLDTGTGCDNNINSTIEAPSPFEVFTNSYSLYQEGAADLRWQVGDQLITRALSAAVAWDNNGAIVLTELDGGGDHGLVLDIHTSDKGNVAISATDGDTISLFGMGNSAEWWKTAAGELKFDLYIDSAATPNDAVISIKMDSGWPALGVKELDVADFPKDSWTTVSVPVNDLIANSGEQPLDTSAVLNLFVIEFNGAAHVQLDNITLACGHKDSNGCGINPPTIEVTGETIDVFSDEVNETLWTKGMGAWDTAINSDYYTGDSDNHVNWQLIDSGETGHDTVVEVSFNADGSDGVFYFQSAAPVNLTALSEGELVFDIKVTDYGSNSSGITFKVDCIFPCTTGDQSLGVIADDQWQTIHIPVAQLVSHGLNLSSVNTGLVIFPTWGDQQGITFLLDNVRWQPMENEPTAPSITGEGLVIFSESFDSNWSLWDCCGGATVAEVNDGDEHGNVSEVAFNSVPTVAGLEASSLVDVSQLTHGTLEFDFKLVSAPADNSAVWRLKLESDAGATPVEVTLTTSNEGVAPTLGAWQHFTFDLETLASQGLDLTKLKLIMVFPDWGKAEGAVYRLDNVIIQAEGSTP